jgi:hypothetical protein
MRNELMGKILIFAFSFLVCMIFTANQSEAANWEYNLTVSRVAVHDDCYIIDTNSGLSNCAVAGRFAIPASASNAKEIYATALTAFLTGKFIDIYYDIARGCIKGGIFSFLIEIHN